jgi:hypothetical protein
MDRMNGNGNLFQHDLEEDRKGEISGNRTNN